MMIVNIIFGSISMGYFALLGQKLPTIAFFDTLLIMVSNGKRYHHTVGYDTGGAIGFQE